MSAFKKIYSLMRADKYTAALRELEKLEKKRILHPKIYELKGICIFKSNNLLRKYHYEDITLFYKKALEIDETYVDVLTELGHHYYAAENESKKALPLFEKSLRILKYQVMDAITGYAKCIEETKSPKDAIKYLDDVKANFFDVKKINELKKELTEM